MAKTSVMVAWSFESYSYLQLTIAQVSDCCSLGLLFPRKKGFEISCKLSCKETNCMQFKSLSSGIK